MSIHNADIAAIFEQIAEILEIENANPFRIRAYQNATRNIQGLGKELATMVEQGEDLIRLPAIGKDLASKIEEIVKTGKCRSLEKLRHSLPSGLTELLKVPGLGPKRVHAIYHELNIHTPEQLLRAAHDGRLQQLHGFGPKTSASIITSLEKHIRQKQRIKLAIAAQYAEPLADYLRKQPDVDNVVIAGSYRRRRETVGDIDILVSANNSQPVMTAFTGYEEIATVQSQGKTRSTVVLNNGLQVDLRVVPEKSFGAALHYFTGSKSHNIRLRRRAQKQGLKINEYGVFSGKKQIAGRTEESVYKALSLPWIAPELRENQGEIEAAEHNRLPVLVELKDLQGDLHAHTKATDGHNSLKEMAEAARERGLSYLAITEHSKRLTVAHGLDEDRLFKQIETIDELNDSLHGITLLKGIEVDILEDGGLDLPDHVLARLDLVVGAVHSKFNLSREQQTERIIRAMQHPHFSILAHPTGRLLEQRDPYDVDMDRIIREAHERGCYLELNAHPERLDLLDSYCRMASEEGVLVSINSDAHSLSDFDNLVYGIGQARRGWLKKQDVLNTRTLAQIRKRLKRTM
jgi:DNA polymerase (family 10)